MAGDEAVDDVVRAPEMAAPIGWGTGPLFRAGALSVGYLMIANRVPFALPPDRHLGSDRNVPRLNPQPAFTRARSCGTPRPDTGAGGSRSARSCRWSKPASAASSRRMAPPLT